MEIRHVASRLITRTERYAELAGNHAMNKSDSLKQNEIVYRGVWCAYRLTNTIQVAMLFATTVLLCAFNALQLSFSEEPVRLQSEILQTNNFIVGHWGQRLYAAIEVDGVRDPEAGSWVLTPRMPNATALTIKENQFSVPLHLTIADRFHGWICESVKFNSKSSGGTTFGVTLLSFLQRPVASDLTQISDADRGLLKIEDLVEGRSVVLGRFGVPIGCQMKISTIWTWDNEEFKDDIRSFSVHISKVNSVLLEPDVVLNGLETNPCDKLRTTLTRCRSSIAEARKQYEFNGPAIEEGEYSFVDLLLNVAWVQDGFSSGSGWKEARLLDATDYLQHGFNRHERIRRSERKM